MKFSHWMFIVSLLIVGWALAMSALFAAHRMSMAIDAHLDEQRRVGHLDTSEVVTIEPIQ